MTIQEASERYEIPLDILREYESWGLRVSVKNVTDTGQYDDQDIERLSMIMTLHDIGFDSSQAEEYMRLFLKKEDTSQQRLKMLDRQREIALDEIHLREKQLERMDYLRFKIENSRQSRQQKPGKYRK